MNVSKEFLGWTFSIIVFLFLVMDGAMKVLQARVAVETTVKLGYPAHILVSLGVLTLVIALMYVIPRTALVGAILMTGLLGGAVATHVRVESPLFSHVLFGVYVGVVAWAGLFLRDERLRDALLLRP